MLAFITSFDEVTMTVFIASPSTETLPVRMFLYIQDNIDPLVASVSAGLIALTVIVDDRPRSCSTASIACSSARKTWHDDLTQETRYRGRRWRAASAPPSPGASRRLGKRVGVLDEGDDRLARLARQFRAGLGADRKGLGMPEYAAWTKRSSAGWAGLAVGAEGRDRHRRRSPATGRFHALRCPKRSTQRRIAHNAAAAQSAEMVRYPYEMLDHAGDQEAAAGYRPEVVGCIYCPLDGHVNSLRLFRALHPALASARRRLSPEPAGRGDCIATAAHSFCPGRGANSAPEESCSLPASATHASRRMVGLDAPVRPQRGQIIVTEKAAAVPALSDRHGATDRRGRRHGRRQPRGDRFRRLW